VSSPWSSLIPSDEVREAIESNRPVVALESTIISHGLPRPRNLEVALEVEAAVRRRGAVPATIALLDGQVRIGLEDAALERVATDPGVHKVSVRDLPIALAVGAAGATTVASTSYLARLAGIRLFATGGIGGVHRGAATSFDESADLTTLSRPPITLVCAGVKSILDVPATLERMETLSIGLVGYRTGAFPGFYRTDSGSPVPWRLESPEQIARAMAARRALGIEQALVVALPVAEEAQVDADLHDRVLAEGLERMAADGISGKEATPYLLAHFHRETGGASLETNIAIILANADLAARIAVADAELRAA
jgi:pseudouridine-5'-phosphate glycosidase